MREATYPADHRPGMRVTKGGSMCANCEYLRPDRKTCGNSYFVKWHGSNVIPGEINAYCSDWWEPRKSKDSMRMSELGRSHG